MSRTDLEAAWFEIERMVPGARSNPRTWVALKKAVERAAIEEAQHGERGYVCQECGRAYWSWFTDDLFWNLVMTPEGEAVRDDPGGLLCVECFIKRAEAIYAVAGWKVIPTFGYTRRDEPAAVRAEVVPPFEFPEGPFVEGAADELIDAIFSPEAAHRDSEGREGCEVPGCGHAESAHTREGSEGSSACTECRCPVYVLMGEDVTEQFARDSEGEGDPRSALSPPAHPELTNPPPEQDFQTPVRT